MSQPSLTPVTVTFATGAGTATAGTDYVAVPAAPMILAPGTTAANRNVFVVGDAVREANETFTCVLSNPVNATIMTGLATATIQNDD